MSRFASHQELRAAYLALMKRHHPDRHLHQARPSDAAELQSIIESYATLSDTDRRSQYDLTFRTALPIRIAPQPVANSKQANTNWQAVALLVSGYFAIFALAFYFLQTWPNASEITDAFASPFERPRLEQPEMPMPIEDEDLRAETRTAISTSPSSAMAKSANCYATARETGASTAADRCVIFDAAFAYWHQNDNNAWWNPSYFRTSSLERRALTAFAELDSEQAAARLEALRSMAFSMLLRQVSHPRSNTQISPSLAKPLAAEPVETRAIVE